MKTSTSTSVGRLFGCLLVEAIGAAVEHSNRNSAQYKEREEAARWERRKQAVFDTIDRALMADHGRYYVSNATKARTAARLRADITNYCERRSEALTQHVESQATHFEQFGT